MLFNSFEFIIFLPIVIIFYYIIPHRFRWVLLLIASYFFYMMWNPKYIILIIISTVIDYFAGIMMSNQKVKSKRKKYLLLSLFANLGLLFVFKYFNFFNSQAGLLFEAFSNAAYPISSLKLLLPMGISFYTFQTLSYTIDVYKGTRKPERHLGYFALYVTYFPQLVAGPIERSQHLLPQLRKKHDFNYECTISALLRICWGLFKKVIIADRVAVIVNTIYGDLPSYSGIYLIIATVGFAIQIYCDFSAYSDIAIGSAKLMGIDLMENFKTPYFSKSITEFWKRWHISLSTWFRDYLYIPLGGSRVSKKWMIFTNIMIVFVVSGLWHGANWTFIIWGFLNGLYLILERLIPKIRIKSFSFSKIKIPSIIKQLFTFSLTLIGWVFFRSNNISDSLYVFKNLSPTNIMEIISPKIISLGLDKYDIVVLGLAIIWLFITELYKYSSKKDAIINNDLRQGISVVLLILFLFIFGFYGNYDSTQFIYFQF